MASQPTSCAAVVEVNRRSARVARLEALAMEEGMVVIVDCQEKLNL
jgi:hypothetical protein